MLVDFVKMQVPVACIFCTFAPYSVKTDVGLATGAGWSERLNMENDNTGKRTYMGTAAYEGSLAPNAAVECSVSYALSDYPGISGLCRPVVVIRKLRSSLLYIRKIWLFRCFYVILQPISKSTE